MIRPRLVAVSLATAALCSILLGLALTRHPDPTLPSRIWLAGLVLTGGPVVAKTLRGLLTGRFAADVVASLAILAALFLLQPLPGLIVVLMQTGGEALERYAEGRASNAVRQLEAAAPRLAHRLTQGRLEDISAEEIAVGDALFIRPGELVPCDAVVSTGESQVDASRLTGEPMPVQARPGTRLPSGCLNGHSPLTVEATAPAKESQYARIVELVRTAQASKSPLQRLADRYAVWFTPVTLLLCLIAFLASGDSERVLAILVVATPCPLILAAPVAVIGGISRAARRGIIFRHGEALEQLGQVTTGVFDKTGTLTIGRPKVECVRVVGPFTETQVLRLAGAVEQGSGHLLARTVVEAAVARVSALPEASAIVESPGLGVRGVAEGHRVAVGALPYVRAQQPSAEVGFRTLPDGLGRLRAYVAVDGAAAGAIEFADQPRAGAIAFFDRLRRLGIRRTLLLTGDEYANADAVARTLGIREFRAELLPADKVAAVNELVGRGERVLMVGDGTNDAPALASATVGIALAAHGGGISAQAAGVVLLADDLSRVADAIAISRRTLRIARQSIWIGLALSGTAMLFASGGAIPPIAGALLQETIDVAVILHALRATRE